MSKDISLDGPLSRADREYLDARGAWGQAMIERMDQNYPPSDEDVEWWANRNVVGTGPVAGDTALRDENERLKELLREAGVTVPGEEDDEEDDEEEAPYSDWTVVELKDELRKRGLQVSGTQSELIARLEEDDATKA